ncbi:MAG: hypothetical protein J7577_22995 [Sphingobacteriaceae bacterium]|nr:hypothetical protein [Sphingobacteriaceae bacterium]
MKNFKLLLAGAIMIAVGSAFTAAPKESKFAGEYVKINGVYQLKGDGECHSDLEGTCDYTIIDPNGSLTDDNNFTRNNPGQWVQ